MYNIADLTFHDAPSSFYRDGGLLACEIAELPDGRQVILGLPIESHRAASVAVQTENGEWLGSEETRDWPKISHILDGWKPFVASWEADKREELDEDL